MNESNPFQVECERADMALSTSIAESTFTDHKTGTDKQATDKRIERPDSDSFERRQPEFIKKAVKQVKRAYNIGFDGRGPRTETDLSGRMTVGALKAARRRS